MTDITKMIAKSKPGLCRIDSPVYDHYPHGWFARNSIYIQDCVPWYGNPSCMASESELTDLPTAIDRSITILRHRVSEAESLISKLEALKGDNDA